MKHLSEAGLLMEYALNPLRDSIDELLVCLQRDRRSATSGDINLLLARGKSTVDELRAQVVRMLDDTKERMMPPLPVVLFDMIYRAVQTAMFSIGIINKPEPYAPPAPPPKDGRIYHLEDLIKRLDEMTGR